MKQVTCIILISIAFFSNIQGQNAYYDAIKLKNINEVKSNDGYYDIELISTNANQLLISIQILSKYFNPIDKKEINISVKSINQKITLIDSLSHKLKIEGIDNPTKTKLEKAIEKEKTDLQIATNELNDTFMNKFNTLPTNPFFSWSGYARTYKLKTPDKASIFKQTMNKAAGVDVTTLSQGLAQFMIERAKSELNVAFFEKFKNFADTNEEIKLLFPVTTNRLSYLLSFHYSEMLNQLRNAFYEDLNNLSDNMLTYLKTGQDFEQLRNTEPEFIIAIESLELLRQFEYLTPPEIISKLPNITEKALKLNLDAEEKKNIENLRTLLTLSSIYSKSCTDTSNNRNWISSKSFYDNIINDPITLKIYNGLIFQQIKTHSLKINGYMLSQSIANSPDLLSWYSKKIDEFIYLTNKVDKTAKEINNLVSNNTKFDNSQLNNYISTTLSIFDFGNQFIEKYGEPGTYQKLDKYLSLSHSANDLYRYLYQTEYSSAVISCVEILEHILPSKKISAEQLTQYYNINQEILDEYNENPTENIELINKVVSNKSHPKGYKTECKTALNNTKNNLKSTQKKLSKKDITLELSQEFNLQLINYKQDINKANLNKIKKYFTFMANLVEAESPQDISYIIESTALPAGSSSIKKNSSFNVAINSYLGASFINQKIDSKSKNNAWNSPVNLSAPIGITCSWGLAGNAGSISATGVLIDIGAIVDYQYANDSTIDTKITLGNIFSPGAYLFYDFGKSIPLSFGGGVQYGPGLTSIENSSTTIINASNLRFNLLFVVDIPLFNLYNKPKN